MAKKYQCPECKHNVTLHKLNVYGEGEVYRLTCGYVHNDTQQCMWQSDLQKDAKSLDVFLANVALKD